MAIYLLQESDTKLVVESYWTGIEAKPYGQWCQCCCDHKDLDNQTCKACGLELKGNDHA